MAPYWARSQIGKLQPRRVGFLVGKNNLEPGHFADVVRAIANAPKREFQFVILAFPPALNNDMRRAGILSVGSQKSVRTFHAERQGNFIRVSGVRVPSCQVLLLNRRGDNRKSGFLNQPVQPVHEVVTFLLVLQEHERGFLLSDFMLMQHHNIVTEMREFERLNTWHDIVRVGAF